MCVQKHVRTLCTETAMKIAGARKSDFEMALISTLINLMSAIGLVWPRSFKV